MGTKSYQASSLAISNHSAIDTFEINMTIDLVYLHAGVMFCPLHVDCLSED